MFVHTLKCERECVSGHRGEWRSVVKHSGEWEGFCRYPEG